MEETYEAQEMSYIYIVNRVTWQMLRTNHLLTSSHQPVYDINDTKSLACLFKPIGISHRGSHGSHPIQSVHYCHRHAICKKNYVFSYLLPLGSGERGGRETGR